ncbi:aldose epimerase family protein [Vagococcus vulneris]|uniref:Aldose 1-epimerase n=1 Tax=Vagococcus vulneris TaxID=1977869 RepID=A0A429ZYL8_9ENTE|nr:aldose epimerase family protein [Vagococcus vulneris]RST99079.1 hypothetical protein CBF37_05285 [Vagococcus vulneris]
METAYHVVEDQETGIHYITLENGPLKAVFVDFGARMHQFFVPDKNGVAENIFLSLDTPQEILADTAQFGATVGPVAGRIKQASWGNLQLERNQGEHHIHGGSQGWWCRFWSFTFDQTNDSVSVTFHLKDSLSGYPGPISVDNTYELTHSGITMTTRCHAAQTTIVNPTNHVYFNLSGNSKRDITEHVLTVHSLKRLELTENKIPTGKLLSNVGSPYDFYNQTRLADNLAHLPSGIDDAYLLNGDSPQIRLVDPESGRSLTISTNRQAVVIFSTTGFNDTFKVNGQPMFSHAGLALETQELPDIIHHPEWGSIDLPKNQEKIFITRYTVR